MVNQWQMRMDGGGNNECLFFHIRAEESVSYRFWECNTAKRTWQWGIHIMNIFIEGKEARGPWRMLTWKQGIFSERISMKFNRFKRVWAEIRTIVICALDPLNRTERQSVQ